jgi:hypothetical protein
MRWICSKFSAINAPQPEVVIKASIDLVKYEIDWKNCSGWSCFVPPLAGVYAVKLCFVTQNQPRTSKRVLIVRWFLA